VNTTAIVVMVVICTILWGGFAALLARAVRSEGRKRAEGGPDGGGTA